MKTENPQTDTLEIRFADLVFSETFPEIWLDLFADESFSVRKSYYRRLTDVLSAVFKDDGSVDGDEVRILAEELISGKSSLQAVKVFQGTRTRIYLAFISKKTDEEAIKRLYGLAFMASKEN